MKASNSTSIKLNKVKLLSFYKEKLGLFLQKILYLKNFSFQGMFIVSLPYAVLHGGYWAIVAMIGIAYICCYTGKILVDCLYELDENGQLQRVRHSYKGIAKEVFGPKYGGTIINAAQVNIDILSLISMHF